MRGMKNLALVLGGLALGILAGVAFVPRSLAQGAHPAPPPRWQQFCEPVSSIPEASSVAGARGTEGWELVTYAAGVMCFKRPAPPKGAETGWPGY
jgi:hypothetical protein